MRQSSYKTLYLLIASKQWGRFTEIAAFRTGDILAEQRNENCNLKEMKHDENVTFCYSHHEDVEEEQRYSSVHA